MSLSDQLLLVVSEGGINFSLIREIVKKVTGYDNRKVIWSTLERLFKRGFLKKTHTKEGISFGLTASGAKALPEDPIYIKKPDRAWDKKWRLVIFDMPESKRKEKDTFLVKLKEIGFAKMQDSTYVTMHDRLEDAKKIARSLKIFEFVKIMLIEDIGVENEAKFVNNIWSLDELNKEYRYFVKKYQNGYSGKEFSSEVLR